jgi:hypothetical protein
LPKGERQITLLANPVGPRSRSLLQTCPLRRVLSRSDLLPRRAIRTIDHIHDLPSATEGAIKLDEIGRDLGERLDPTEVDSTVVLVWSGPYLGLAVEELVPGPLMELKQALQAACATLCRRSAPHVSAPPRYPFRAVPRHLIKVGTANGLARNQFAPAFSARARTLSSGKAVMKMNGTP